MAKKGKRARDKRKKPAPGRRTGAPVRSGAGMSARMAAWSTSAETEGIDRLEKASRGSPRDPRLHLSLGELYARAGRMAEAFDHLEAAARLAPESGEVQFARAIVYDGMGMHSHALEAARRFLKLEPTGQRSGLVTEVVRHIDAAMHEWAARLRVPVDRMEQGSRLMEEGRLALSMQDLGKSMRASRQASKLLPQWAVPRNNLALAQFFLGNVDEAIATEEKVLAEADPDNIHALGNLVRFYSTLGQTDKAQALGHRLAKQTPVYYDDRLKLAEAFAVLKRDRGVYDALGAAEPPGVLARSEREWYLAVAAANMGKMAEARSYLDRVDLGGDPFRGKVATFIREGLPGPWGRYPYYAVVQYLPRRLVDRMLGLFGQRREGAGTGIKDIAQRYPALVDMAAESLWFMDEDVAKSAVDTLRTVGGERVAELLRSFAGGQIGSDELRMHAAQALAVVEPGVSKKPVTVTREGRPTETLIRQVSVVTSKKPTYSAEIERMTERAIIAQREEKDREAEQIYEKILSRNPKVKEAWGNLGVIYLSRGEREKGEQYIKRAIEVDPRYITGRTNLASLRLSEGKIDEAKELLRPLSDVSEFQVEEIVRYLSVTARLEMAERHFDAARNNLELVLRFDPDNKRAKETMKWIEGIEALEKGVEWFDRYRQRYRESKRKQAISPADDLTALLSRYSKDALIGVAREIQFSSKGGLAGVKKNALLAGIRDYLLNPEALANVVRNLKVEEREALRYVLQAGGWVPEEDFSRKYGSEADESPHWNGHVPETVLGRLKVRGLLFEGTFEGRVVLVVPEEIRPLCRKLSQLA